MSSPPDRGDRADVGVHLGEGGGMGGGDRIVARGSAARTEHPGAGDEEDVAAGGRERQRHHVDLGIARQ
ncbi:Uncharacterised protein [Mycobacteroides abscessus subsp. abscessus]|nr:Uncharacterised protein [Mycobacteroides abscessus subsp. abscessus]